jgi:two-component system KDP operon response regulator KdpE
MRPVQRQDAPNQTILVVDDEPRVARLIRHTLGPAGFRVVEAADGDAGVAAIRDDEPDLVLLDVVMPGPTGFDVCRRIREFSDVPIIMLTGLGREADRVGGLEAGADDYVVKPFSPNELVARVRAVLRRSRREERHRRPGPVDDGWLRVDFESGEVRRGDGTARLSRTELRLLTALVEHAGRVVMHEELRAQVWGEEYKASNEQLRTYVKYLRRKIEPEPETPRYLLTQPGVGYLFRLPR